MASPHHQHPMPRRAHDRTAIAAGVDRQWLDLAAPAWVVGRSNSVCSAPNNPEIIGLSNFFNAECQMRR